MRVIGITGGIGSGKSVVLHMLRDQYGAYIVETDRLAHDLMQPGEPAYEEIVETFGTKILCPDKTIDRGQLGAIVFSDDRKRKQLNAIVHPAVKQTILADIERKRQEGTISLYVIEAALLIEDGYRFICDELWYVYVEQEERIKRLLAGRGGDMAKWKSIIDSQSKEEFYRAHCDRVIDNSEDIKNTANILKEILCSSI